MRVFVAGHRGMVGSAIARRIKARGDELVTRTREELDLTDQLAVRSFFSAEKVDAVVLAAAKVGGIHANNRYPAEFAYSNLMIQANVIHEAYKAGIERLLFLGSSCIYPRMAAQPMREEALLTGPLEPTNEPYAIAKIAGVKMCESYNRQYGVDYRSVMPTNLYGEGDSFHPEDSHVIPALLRRFHEAVCDGAEQVKIWGTGKARREFLHVNDMADASLFVFDLPAQAFYDRRSDQLSHINIGYGDDIRISDLAALIAGVAGFSGEILFDPSRPDGPPRKLLECSALSQLGWKPRITLEKGLEQTYRWFLKNGAQSVPE